MKAGMVTHMCNPTTWETEDSLDNIVRLVSTEDSWEYSPEVEYVPSMCEALGLSTGVGGGGVNQQKIFKCYTSQ